MVHCSVEYLERRWVRYSENVLRSLMGTKLDARRRRNVWMSVKPFIPNLVEDGHLVGPEKCEEPGVVRVPKFSVPTVRTDCKWWCYTRDAEL
jgi:hypothetical protein